MPALQIKMSKRSCVKVVLTAALTDARFVRSISTKVRDAAGWACLVSLMMRAPASALRPLK